MSTNTALNRDTDDTFADLQYVDPATLLVDTNIRQIRIDKAFTASIRQHGVLVPIVAVRTEDGLRVRYGHRRALAAIRAGRSPVPVCVTGADDADDAARIVGQWSENEHRAALTTGERIGAIEQLSLLGLTAGQIAHRTRATKADVHDALAVSASDLARKAADRYGFLTLEQSAALVEFDGPDHDEEAITALIAAAHEGQVHFDRALLAAREQVADRKAHTDAAGALTTEGVTIIDRPDWNSPIKRLASLQDGDGTALVAVSHSRCPGHAAWLDEDWDRRTETAEAEVDSDDSWVRVYRAVYVCTDPSGNGHHGSGGRQLGLNATNSDTAEDDAAAEATPGCPTPEIRRRFA